MVYVLVRPDSQDKLVALVEQWPHRQHHYDGRADDTPRFAAYLGSRAALEHPAAVASSQQTMTNVSRDF